MKGAGKKAVEVRKGNAKKAAKSGLRQRVTGHECASEISKHKHTHETAQATMRTSSDGIPIRGATTPFRCGVKLS